MSACRGAMPAGTNLWSWPIPLQGGSRRESVEALPHGGPAAVSDEEREGVRRAESPTLPVASRRKNFAEVEMTLSAEAAAREARRCLRCDLAFTQGEPQ